MNTSPDTKRCFKCDQVLSLTEFYRHPGMADGHLNKCRGCAKRDVTENRTAKIEKYREFDRQRANLPHRVAARAAYAKTASGRAAFDRSKKRWQQRNPEKRAAHVIVGNAIRDGKLQRQPCEKCGSKDVHAHHDDYDRPLDVRWLCPSCHSEHHHNEPEAFTKQ